MAVSVKVKPVEGPEDPFVQDIVLASAMAACSASLSNLASPFYTLLCFQAHVFSSTTPAGEK
jgi:hypothetical protein